jgi:hypothetical protein
VELSYTDVLHGHTSYKTEICVKQFLVKSQVKDSQLRGIKRSSLFIKQYIIHYIYRGFNNQSLFFQEVSLLEGFVLFWQAMMIWKAQSMFYAPDVLHFWETAEKIIKTVQ